MPYTPQAWKMKPDAATGRCHGRGEAGHELGHELGHEWGHEAGYESGHTAWPGGAARRAAAFAGLGMAAVMTQDVPFSTGKSSSHGQA